LIKAGELLDLALTGVSPNAAMECALSGIFSRSMMSPIAPSITQREIWWCAVERRN
jgi:hypothetical protein